MINKTAPMERGILFDKRQVLAVLNNQMTQTRRVMRVQPPENAFDAKLCTPIRGDYMPSNWKNTFGYMWGEPSFKKADLTLNELKFVASPYGKVGDLLYVRETWCKQSYRGPILEVIKTAPRLHREKNRANQVNSIARSLAFRTMKLMNEAHLPQR